MKKLSVKRSVIWLHKQLGLWLGLFVVIIGLTGSAVVFMEDLEPIFYSEFLAPKKISGKNILPEQALATIEQHTDKKTERILRLYEPTDKYPVYRGVTTTLNENGKGTGDFYFHYIEPKTGEHLGQQLAKTHNANQWHMPLFRLLLGIHTHLMVGHYGELFIGLVGIFFLFTLLLGYYLWWPKLSTGKKNIAQWFSVTANRGRTRLFFDIHRQLGFFLGFVLILSSFTGIYLTFPKQFTRVTQILLPVEDHQLQARKHTITDSGEEQPLSVLSAYVKTQEPNGVNLRYYLHDREQKKITIAISNPEDPNRTEGKTEYRFNSISGIPFSISKAGEQTSGNQFIHWLFPLHNGEAFGITSKIIMFVAGLTPLFLYISALVVWFRKWKKQPQQTFTAFIGFLFRY